MLISENKLILFAISGLLYLLCIGLLNEKNRSYRSNNK